MNREIELVYDSKAAYSLSDSAILVTGDRINMPLVDMADQPSQLEALRSTYGFGVSGLGDATAESVTASFQQYGKQIHDAYPSIYAAITGFIMQQNWAAAQDRIDRSVQSLTGGSNDSSAAPTSWWSGVYAAADKAKNVAPGTTAASIKTAGSTAPQQPGLVDQFATSVWNPFLNYLTNKPQRTVVRVTKGPPPGPDMMTIGLLVGGVLLTGILVFAIARSGKRS